MIPSITDIYGKRIKAARPLKMSVSFPGSGNVVSIPAGQPSPLIDSIIPRGEKSFIQVMKNGVPGYIEYADDLEFVGADAADDSGIFESIGYNVSDWFNNTLTDGRRYSGYVSDGLQESISGLKVDAFSLSKELKFWAILVAVIVILSTLKNLIK